MKIANRDAHNYVVKCHPFEGSNLTGQLFCVDPKDKTEGQYGYVVYSYGNHFPLFACVHIDGIAMWFENEDGYSRTTSRHRTQSHPRRDTTKLSPEWMQKLVTGGYRALVATRLQGAPA